VKNGKTKIIACKTVIEEIGDLLPQNAEAHSLESGLHLNPDRLRNALQAMIDEFTTETETIILGYGLCSLGVVGLRAAQSTLIIPRLDDCIAIFLGSREAYKREMDQEPGTYFLSRGWIDAGITLLGELRGMEEKYGKERAERLMKRMIQHYTRLAFIDMGYEDQERYRETAKEVARELDLGYQEVKGTTGLLNKMLTGPWDDEFIVAPPGHTVTLEDFNL
jgi:hypothetical protein